MAYTRLSLRAAILFTFIAIGEVSAAPQKHHRRRGRCSPPHTASSALSVTLDLSTSISSSTIETIAIPISTSTSTSELLSAPESDTSTVLSETSSVSTAEETTSTPSVEETSTWTTSIEETTSVPSSSLEETSTSTEETFTSAEPTSSESTSSEELPTSTSSASTTSEELATTSEAATTSSAPACEPTVSTWAPELCWKSVPARCSSMTATTLAAGTLTAHINACATNLQVYGHQLALEVTGCFSNLGQPDFNPTSAYTCISNAPLYCTATSTCAPAATSTPLIPPYSNPSFEESSTLGSWTQTGPSTPGNLIGSISTEQSHSGQHSLKLQSLNLADDFIAFEHRLQFEPGARYEFSFWYYSLSKDVRGTLSLKVEYPGTSMPLAVQISTQVIQRWTQQKFSITPTTSFGSVSVTYLANKASVGNVLYVDDVTVTKTG